MARRLLVLLFLAQIVFQLQLTSQWKAYRDLTRERLACVRGLVPVDVALGSGLEALHVSPEWMHGWHHSSLSLIDPEGPVKSLLGLARGYTGWQPFDPLDPLALPRVSRYGIDTSAYRSAVESRAREKGVPWESTGECSLTGAPVPF